MHPLPPGGHRGLSVIPNHGSPASNDPTNDVSSERANDGGSDTEPTEAKCRDGERPYPEIWLIEQVSYF